MEVTKANFKESLELLRKLIPDASFLSVDGEFTGLNVATNFHGFDTPQERYRKIRKVRN
ncbi:poly(A)-specific ribonuclease PARN-like [Saccoglossus kowalevskii]